MDTLAPFRSRSEALKLFNELKKLGIAVTTVSTPQRLRLGCGLSVVFNSALKEYVAAVISRLHLKSFVGFFPL